MPFSVNAESRPGFTPVYAGWKDLNGNNLSMMNNTLYYSLPAHNVSTGWHNISAYTSGITFTANTYDYALINVAWTAGNGDITYCTGNSSAYCTEYSTYPSSSVFTAYTYNVRNDATLRSDCYSLSVDGDNTKVFTLYCPILYGANSINQIRFDFYKDTGWLGSEVNIGISGTVSLHYLGSTGSEIATAIESQTNSITQAQEDTTTAINDMNDTINNSDTTGANSQANNFFSNFSTESNGHLTQVVTAPLTLLSSLTATCEPITLPFNFDNMNNSLGSSIPDKNVSLPCGTTLFWENNSLGNKVTNFRSFWNILIGGPIIYGLLVLCMQSFNNALDPINDELLYLEFNSEQEQIYRDMRSMEVREMANIAKSGDLHSSAYKKYFRFRKRD